MEESNQIIPDEVSMQHDTSNAIHQMRVFLYISITFCLVTISEIILIMVRIYLDKLLKEVKGDPEAAH